jgi:phosphomethylpyrimidine synthase
MKISQEIRDVEAEKGMKEKSEEFIEGGKRFIAR